MASRKQVVPMEGEGSTTTTVPRSTTTTVPQGWTPPPDTTGDDGTDSAAYQAYMQSKLDEAWNILKVMDVKKRKETLEFLRSKGINSNYDVSWSGLETPDLYRYREFLIYKETSDISMKEAMARIGNLPNAVIADGASRRQNIKDVDAVFTNVVQEMIGRQPTKKELESFRSAYSGMEASGNAPTVQVAAQAQLQEKMPDETKAAQFADYATVFEQMLRGG